jgi:hypothetical protein
MFCQTIKIYWLLFVVKPIAIALQKSLIKQFIEFEMYFKQRKKLPLLCHR